MANIYGAEVPADAPADTTGEDKPEDWEESVTKRSIQGSNLPLPVWAIGGHVPQIVAEVQQTLCIHCESLQDSASCMDSVTLPLHGAASGALR